MNRLVVGLLAAMMVTGWLAGDSAFCASDQRTALIIGNGAYKEYPLRNPSNDAMDLARVLKKLGFSVTTRINASHRTMEEAIHQFGQTLRSGGVGLFYYAGHGVQVNGVNYLIPIDAEIRDESDVKFESVDAGRILSKMENAGNGLNIIILDACRNNPFRKKFRSVNRGLAKMDAPTGSILAYSTAPGSVAADGQGRNGLYTSRLLKYINQEGLNIESFFKKVRIEVMQASGNSQVPWESSSLTIDFYFFPSQKAQQPPPMVVAKEPDGRSAEILFWESVKDSNDMKMYQEYIRTYPNGTYVGLAEIKIKHLTRVASGSRVASVKGYQKSPAAGADPTRPRMKLAIFPWKPADDFWNAIIIDAIEEALRKHRQFIPSFSYYDMDPEFAVKKLTESQLLSISGAANLDALWNASSGNDWTPNSGLVVRIANDLGVDAVMLCSIEVPDSDPPRGNISMFLIDVWSGDTRKVNEFISRLDEDGLDRSIELGKALLERDNRSKW